MERDLRSLLDPYKGEWVALSSDEKEVLGHGKTMDEALEMARAKKGEVKPQLIKVPAEGASFILI